jgi:hypothetical protein
MSRPAIIPLLVFSLLVVNARSVAQGTNDFLLGGGLDLIKTDNQKVFDRAQIGFEANYFITRKFSVAAGLEIWTHRENSFAFGSRWYPKDNIFMRFRGLIGENDFSIGAGGAIPLKNNFRLEIMGDFYFESEFAVRAGLAYLIRL